MNAQKADTVHRRARPDTSILKKNAPSPKGPDAQTETVVMTVHYHDSKELQKMMKNQLIDVGIMAVVHLYLGKSAPMIAQSIIPVKRAIQSNLAQIHLFGKPPIGNLERPFNPPRGILSAVGSRVVQLVTR